MILNRSRDAKHKYYHRILSIFLSTKNKLWNREEYKYHSYSNGYQLHTMYVPILLPSATGSFDQLIHNSYYIVYSTRWNDCSDPITSIHPIGYREIEWQKNISKEEEKKIHKKVMATMRFGPFTFFIHDFFELKAASGK